MINGDLKSLTSLWCHLAQHQRYQPYVSKKDIENFLKRADSEGLPFLTTVLPEIGKAIDRLHATGVWTEPLGFHAEGYWIGHIQNKLVKACMTDSDNLHMDTRLEQIRFIPVFLGGAIKAALEGDSVAVDCVRQLTLIFYKYEVDYDDQVVEEFLDQFIKTDSDLPSLEVNEGNKHSLGTLLEMMRRIIAEVLCNEDPRNIRPCHGGGATACHTANKDKWRTFRYIAKLDSMYPYDSHFYYSPTHLVDEMGLLEQVEEVVSPHARVCLVPKDSRGPRVISCEPAEHMFIQQGLMKMLYDVLETHYLTSDHVNFSDQTTNRELARLGSLQCGYSTIDLSEASDRVSLKLVELVFPKVWVECFAACRSETTDLPNGKVVRLNKFAPMGSSCCFPVEALVFWACAEASHILVGETADQKKLVCGDPSMYVYGDDIICPTEFFDRVVDGLRLIGLVVNEHKSYKAGPFRESCGGDYHLGVDVTPVRVRKALSSEGTGVVNNADLANLFIAKFGSESSAKILESIEESVGYHYPRTLLPIPGTIRVVSSASNDVFFKRRWNEEFQRYEYRILCQAMDVKTYHPADWWELLRKELSRNPPVGSFDIFTSLRHESEESKGIRYESKVKILNSKADPGQYADVHTARMKWTWTWLGEPRGAGNLV